MEHEHEFEWTLQPDEDGNAYEVCTVDDCNAIRIGGIIHNDVYLSTVMEFLGENGVRYKTEGKKITILK